MFNITDTDLTWGHRFYGAKLQFFDASADTKGMRLDRALQLLANHTGRYVMKETNNKKQQIGRFEVTEKIGQGFQGSVFLAHDPILKRQVAIKLLNEAVENQDELQQQLIEGRNIAQLHHPNIVSLFEAGICHDRIYLVFEYVKGHTLRKEIRNQTELGIERALTIIDQILSGLSHAHQQGIMHLDLSPENIMIDENNMARIMDFGLSRHTGHIFKNEGKVTGTPRYLSPEHLNPPALSIQSDIFTIGLILYECLCGEFLLKGDTLADIYRTVRSSRFDFRKLRENKIHPGILDILNKAVSHKPEYRYINAGQMLNDFRETCEEIMSVHNRSHKHSTIEFLLRRMRRNQDFPALSNNLFTINKLTENKSKVSTEKLANFILRDYSLTNKLLKLANSSFYRNFSGKVNSVSRAITILGVNQVRVACNSLMLFDKMTKKAHEPHLRDSLIHSFISGLIARHLAAAIRGIDPEEAFIASMLHSLGRTLTIYYFMEDYEEILDISRELTINEDSAAEIVLGLRLSEIGMIVAKQWQFPDAIIDSMQTLDYMPADESCFAQEQITALRKLASISNSLANIAKLDERADCSQVYAIAFFADPLIKLNANYLFSLINVAHQKFEEFAPVLGLNTSGSAYIDGLRRWLIKHVPEQEPEALSA